MARLKYGPQKRGPISLPFAASQQFHELGGAFVYADGSGNMTLALTATATLLGWAQLGFSPDDPLVTGNAGSRVFTSSGTAADTKELVHLAGSGDCDGFWIPGDATWTEASRGNACDLIGVNDGTKQTADIGTSSTDVLRMIDGSGTDIFVMVNPAKVQADT